MKKKIERVAEELHKEVICEIAYLYHRKLLSGPEVKELSSQIESIVRRQVREQIKRDAEIAENSRPDRVDDSCCDWQVTRTRDAILAQLEEDTRDG